MKPKFKFFGNNAVMVAIAKPGTCWYSRTSKGTREDHLVGLIRNYTPKDKRYTMNIIIGRLNVIWTRRNWGK